MQIATSIKSIINEDHLHMRRETATLQYANFTQRGDVVCAPQLSKDNYLCIFNTDGVLHDRGSEVRLNTDRDILLQNEDRGRARKYPNTIHLFNLGIKCKPENLHPKSHIRYLTSYRFKLIREIYIDIERAGLKKR